jgi:hypothetical protein
MKGFRASSRHRRSEGAELFDEFYSCFVAPARDNNLRSLLGEGDNRGASDAR